MQPATGFVQQEPNNGEPSTEQTEVRIAFDDDNLYLGVICLDSQPDNIVVTQNRRDGSLENTDSVQILFDTFNDKQNGVIFGTSPTGIEYDAQVSKAVQSPLRSAETPEDVTLLVGPEGDFTPEEGEAALAAGFQPATLGEIVLRAETAAFFGISALRYEFSGAGSTHSG